MPKNSGYSKKNLNFETKGRSPSKPKASEASALVGRTETSSIVDSLISLALGGNRRYYGSLEWNERIQAERDKMYLQDPEINTAINKRRERVLNCTVNIESVDENIEKDILRQLQRNNNVENLKRWVLNCITDQFSVIENVWKKVGDRYELEEFREMPNQLFIPHPDGKNVYIKKEGGKQKVAPFGKYILCTNNGSVKNPWGESVLDPLLELSLFRKNGVVFWAKWIERYGLGFFDVSIQGRPNLEKVEAFKEKLDQAILGGTVVHSSDVELSIIYPQGTGEQFEKFNNTIIDTYNRLILGETSTSRLDSRNSSGASDVHDKQGVRRAKKDALLIKKAVSRFIYQYYVINGLDLDKIARCEILFDEGLQLERARRDYLLTQMQEVKFTLDYYVRNYGFRETDLEFYRESDTESQPDNSNQADIDTDEGRGGSPDSRNPTNNSKVAFKDTRKQAKERQDKALESVKEVGQTYQPDPEDFADMIERAGNAKELKEMLTASILEDDIEAQNLLADKLVQAFEKGYGK